MSELRVRMDPLNPGQFFACCGILSLIDRKHPSVCARFEIDSQRPRVAEFTVDVEDGTSLLRAVLANLKQTRPRFLEDGIEAAVRPAVIAYDGRDIQLDWWLNEFHDKLENLKCWAGQVTTRNLFSELLPLLDESLSPGQLFSASQMTKAKFGVDPRSAWNALDFGFSPNEHGVDSATFPAVEILAAFGLQVFRPTATNRENVRYFVWTNNLPASVAQLAFRAPWNGLGGEEHTFRIAKRGQSYKYFTFALN